jgi:hypothetical protein
MIHINLEEIPKAHDLEIFDMASDEHLHTITDKTSS